MFQLVRIDRELPEGFARLRVEAEAEGHRHMTRLAEELASGVQFKALLAAFDEGDLLAVGGLTTEPAEAPEPALRMRRLYVALRARRTGVARTLVNALLQEALDEVALVTVHAGNDDAAAFWEAMGFETAAGQAWSHQFSAIPYSAA